MESKPLLASAIEAARAKLRERFGNSTQVGGKGTARRKNKGSRQSSNVDEKKINALLPRLRCQPIPSIEEVSLLRDDGTLTHFSRPKVQASVGANTYIIQGTGEEKKISDMPLPNQNMDLSFLNDPYLRKMVQESLAKREQKGEDDQDDIPDLVEDFEKVSKE